MSNFSFMYWHWLVLGMILVLTELVIPSFTIFWFGLGGVAVGITLWFKPDLSFSLQLFEWGLFSTVFTVCWFKIFKPSFVHKNSDDIPGETVAGIVGYVVVAPNEAEKGVARFNEPVLGNSEWNFITDDKVEKGDSVAICEISGNTLKVTLQKNN